MPHPFAAPAPLPADLRALVDDYRRPLKERVESKQRLFGHWHARAQALREKSLDVIFNMPDIHLRRLFLFGVEKAKHEYEVGDFFHLEFFREIHAAAGGPDQAYHDELRRGLAIVGPVAPSGRWRPHASASPEVRAEDLAAGAWETRRQIIAKMTKRGHYEGAFELWNSTLEDLEAGFSVGPFYDEAAVAACVGSEDWVCSERFPVFQRGKTRGVDNAKSNGTAQLPRRRSWRYPRPT